jgi:hypothetical protein
MELTAMLDNTSQVHSNQYMVDQNRLQHRWTVDCLWRYPFNLCLGPVGDNSVGDVCYITGRHAGPVFVGDTVFASTEIKDKRDYPDDRSWHVSLSCVVTNS